MYNNGYSKASKFSLEAQKKMQHRSKGKSCGYYMRLVFFFSSLIQSLIIVSLVLFLVYGKKQDSASAVRIQDLEQSFSRLSIDNVALRQQRKNLTMLLNITLTDKARNDWDLAQMRYAANISFYIITELSNNLNQCNMEKMRTSLSRMSDGTCKPFYQPSSDCNCGLQGEQLKAMVTLVQANFTQTTQLMRMEMEQIYKDRDNINLEAIRLRRQKSVLEEEMAAYRIKCKEDFANSLGGISNVSKAFLAKIESLFPRHIPFQLTCQKQRENLEQIRSNCTSLSREVENKFQHYLDSVGDEVSKIQTESSHLKAENGRLVEDYSWCSQNRTGLIREHRQNLLKVQLKYDKEKEQLLMEKRRLSGEKDLLSSSVNFKDKEILTLKEQFKQLNSSCSSKTVGRFGTGTGILTQPGSSLNRFNLGGSSSSSAGSPFSKTGSSSSSSSSSLNKPGSNSLGSSSFGSTGLGSSKTGSGVSSSSSGSSRYGSTGLGSSSSGSTGSVSTGLGVVKKPISGIGVGAGQSTGGLGSNSNSNTGSVGKANSGSAAGWGSWFGTGAGNSNTGSNKLGSGLGKGTTGGSSFGGTGSSFGAGRTGGSSNSGTVNISQHLQQLQRIANPTASEEKKDAPRMFG